MGYDRINWLVSSCTTRGWQARRELDSWTCAALEEIQKLRQTVT